MQSKTGLIIVLIYERRNTEEAMIISCHRLTRTDLFDAINNWLNIRNNIINYENVSQEIYEN